MDTINWLKKFAPGFQQLSDDERQAITHFLFLWSLFEAKALNESGSANAIINSAAQWDRGGCLTAETFGQEFTYFRDRYFADGAFTDHFDGLHLRPNDSCELVHKVLTGKDATPKDVAAVVLIIVYRIRNNLFHGRKWSYELKRQFENFTHANKALIQAIKLHNDVNAGKKTNPAVNSTRDG